MKPLWYDHNRDPGLTTFEWLIGLLLGAVLLSALARRTKVPYPIFLALGGVLLAFVPSGPSWTLEPELALALFVAPVLLDAAFDTSPRDLRSGTGCRRRRWPRIIAVGLTTVAVAVVARGWCPSMPWAAAIALGAIVAPPDAAAATAVLRQVRLPHRDPDDPRRREPAQRRQRAADLSPRRRRRRGRAFQMGEVAPSFVLALAGSLIAGFCSRGFRCR